MSEEVDAVLSDLAEEVARGAKYHRLAIQYGTANDVDHTVVAATDTAVRKIRARIGGVAQ